MLLEGPKMDTLFYVLAGGGNACVAFFYQNKSVMSTFDMSHNIFLIHFPGLSGWLCFPKTMDMWC